MLGLYLQTGRKYPDDADLLILVDDIWKELATRDEFKRRKEAEAESYFWDSLIEYIANERDDSLTRSFGGHQGASATWEQVVRTMARENRFNRRLLSNAFAEFHKGRRSRARIVVSPSGVVYTFLATPKGTDRSHRGDELLGRMFIARGLNLYATTVVGLATEEYDSNGGFSLDSALYYKPEWTEQDSEQMLSMQQATGAFQKVQWTKEHFDEYPPARPADA